MVFIEVDEGSWGAIFSDGYIPEYFELEKSKQKYKKIDNFGLLSNHPQIDKSNDEWFRRFAHVLRRDYHGKKFEEIGECDFLLATFLQGYPRRFDMFFEQKIKPAPPLYKEFTEEFRNENSSYRFFMVFYPIDAYAFSYKCNFAKECTMNVIEKLNFRLKQEDEYRDVEKFEDACRKLLDYIFEPYYAPSCVSLGRLYALNFDAETSDE